MPVACLSFSVRFEPQKVCQSLVQARLPTGPPHGQTIEHGKLLSTTHLLSCKLLILLLHWFLAEADSHNKIETQHVYHYDDYMTIYVYVYVFALHGNLMTSVWSCFICFNYVYVQVQG